MSAGRPWSRRVFLSGLLGLAAAGCESDDERDYQPDYAIKPAVGNQALRFSSPFHPPASLFRVYLPLVDHLNRQLSPVQIKLEAARDYETFEQKLYYRNLAFALCNPYQMLLAEANGYRIFAKMDDDSVYRGLIVTRADARIDKISDLAGHVVCYPAASSLASAMLPQAFLFQNGVDMRRDLDNRYVGSEESALMNVYYGKAAAGATWTAGWHRFQREEPAKAAQLTVRWQTPSLPGYGLVARDDIAMETVKRITDMLVALKENPEGRRLLEHMEVGGFVATDHSAYAEVLAFLKTFNDTIRPIALP
ncbi:MAG: phosphate/phosphite/phosphonate ABC transporter substrate-binding protein [Magnetospirillum gryphiswaldense]|nr:phosphate/phosphite/phosphonate ABC transporter substrate-binding protein [Magnetospirillum gryphiswaldense]